MVRKSSGNPKATMNTNNLARTEASTLLRLADGVESSFGPAAQRRFA
jgi:hypothetical protein